MNDTETGSGLPPPAGGLRGAADPAGIGPAAESPSAPKSWLDRLADRADDPGNVSGLPPPAGGLRGAAEQRSPTLPEPETNVESAADIWREARSGSVTAEGDRVSPRERGDIRGAADPVESGAVIFFRLLGIVQIIAGGILGWKISQFGFFAEGYTSWVSGIPYWINGDPLAGFNWLFPIMGWTAFASSLILGFLWFGIAAILHRLDLRQAHPSI